MMKAKYEYCMAIQESRAERCTELEESEATYSEALSINAGHFVSPVCHALLRTHGAHVRTGSMHFEGGEQKPPRSPNSTPGSLTPSPTNTQG